MNENKPTESKTSVEVRIQSTILLCKNCRYWHVDENDDWNEIIYPLNPETYEPMTKKEYGHDVKRCKSPKLLFYIRPAKDEACVIDGSQYKAELITGENFGCVNFKPIT